MFSIISRGGKDLRWKAAAPLPASSTKH